MKFYEKEQNDYYFCSTDVSVHNSKTIKSIVYPNLTLTNLPESSNAV